MRHRRLTIATVCLTALLSAVSTITLGQSAPVQNAMRPGPEIGDLIASWMAPNSFGQPKRIGEVLGRRGALITFLRSAEW